MCSSLPHEGGDFAALLALLDPDVVLRAGRVAIDAAAARKAYSAPTVVSQVFGAAAVADVFFGRAQAAQPALVNGAAGAVWAPGGQARTVNYQRDDRGNRHSG